MFLCVVFKIIVRGVLVRLPLTQLCALYDDYLLF